MALFWMKWDVRALPTKKNKAGCLAVGRARAGERQTSPDGRPIRAAKRKPKKKNSKLERRKIRIQHQKNL
jgi:hypothetical protein